MQYSRLPFKLSPIVISCSLALGILSLPTQAGVGGFIVVEPISAVTDNVTPNGNNFIYDFTVHNISTCDDSQTTPFFTCDGTEGLLPVLPVIVDWELPWFNNLGIDNFFAPPGWAHAIETVGVPNPLSGWDGSAPSWQSPSDPFFFGPLSPFTSGNQVLHYFLQAWASGGVDIDGIFPSDSVFGTNIPSDAITSLSGFGFSSPNPATAAPYQASWSLFPLQSGDPSFPISNGFPSFSTAIPEPETLTLFLSGLLTLSLIRRRKLAS